MQAALVLMSRAPIAGKTKIRLESHLKAEECAELHKAFLKDRIYNAAADAYQKSNLPVIITWSDLPLLDIDIFTEALAGLKERDIVIGPSDDGGYYLLGMKKPESSLFNFGDKINCSVLDKTIKEASRHNLKCHFLPEASAVDTFKELLELRAEIINKNIDSNYPQHTKDMLDQIFNY